MAVGSIVGIVVVAPCFFLGARWDCGRGAGSWGPTAASRGGGLSGYAFVSTLHVDVRGATLRNIFVQCIGWRCAGWCWFSSATLQAVQTPDKAEI